MVRRRSKSAAKPSRGARPVNKTQGKINKWDKSSDIPLDEEDKFHASRDRILLDGTDDYMDEDFDEEVFALEGMSDDDSDEEEGYDDDGNDDEVGMDVDAATKPKRNKKKDKTESSSSSSEEEETWGTGKGAYYSSNAAHLESDDEEGNALEEQEAIRLQEKLRDAMGEDDFGLVDSHEIEEKQETIQEMDYIPAAEPLPTDKKALIRHLEKTDPQRLALARDWTDTVASMMKTQNRIKQLTTDEPESPSLGMLHLYYQTLLSYLSVLAFYLHLCMDEKYVRQPKLLNSHPAVSRLLTLKQSLMTLEELDFAPLDSDAEEVDTDDLLDDEDDLWMDRMDEDIADMGDEDLASLLLEARAQYASSTAGEKTKSKADAPPKKKRKTVTGTPAPVFDLVEPEFTHSKPSRANEGSSASDAFGELTSLHHADAADKKSRRKTLRFHTSKIESTSARRQGARSTQIGGDDDLPYRERRRDKESRLSKEAQARVTSQGGEDLDDVEPAMAKKSAKESADDMEEDGDGYYDLIQRQSKERKEQKKIVYDAARAAENDYPEDNDMSGPRSLTRAILANKGLTPHRPKSVRNPRVKKRQKFEKTKRKISSQKAVYKGGVGDSGRYDGEKSGISKVVKSIRLG